MSGREQDVVLGRVSGVYGIRGWVKVYSYTDPPEAIADYQPWQLRNAGTSTPATALEVRRQGRAIVARLAEVDDRDAALALVGAEIAVERAQLPPAQEGEYYWADLIGLEVQTRNDVVLGRVGKMIATGANDVLVVHGERERLIPWLPGTVVIEVDVDAGRIVVDWDPDF